MWLKTRNNKVSCMYGRLSKRQETGKNLVKWGQIKKQKMADDEDDDQIKKKKVADEDDEDEEFEEKEEEYAEC